jgi:hypothetical protein
VARQDCKLTLARFFFSAAEVTARIASLTRLSQGVRHWINENPTEVPLYEQAIVANLVKRSQVYWSSRNTPSNINSLIECPIGTVALTLKLPGSDVEFEIKRSGIRSRHPLDVRTFEGAYRLYGGSSGVSSDREALSGVRLAELFRHVHKSSPPMSVSREISSIQTIPSWQGNVHLLDYFTDRRTFGNGFRKMRENMLETVTRMLTDQQSLNAPGALGLTVEFLRLMPPRQAWLENSTSYRLDMLERYLSPEGPQSYFAKGLSRNFTYTDTRRFADDLLEEILGIYEPPTDTTGPYDSYVARAFAKNRKSADRTYVCLLDQAGKFFGTLLATWGCSFGESFVRRNVGLKSQWRNGEWAAQIIFMDHDALWVPGQTKDDFDPKQSLKGLRLDHGYWFAEEKNPEQARGTLRTLTRIYRVRAAVRAEGELAFHDATLAAYRETRRSMRGNPHVRQMFDPDVINKIADWDSVVWNCVNSRRSNRLTAEWKSESRAKLRQRGYSSKVIESWIRAANNNAGLLEHYYTLFDPQSDIDYVPNVPSTAC